MNPASKEQVVIPDEFPPRGAERLKEPGIHLPQPPAPFGSYVEAVQTGSLLFLSGMLPTEGGGAKYTGRVGRSSMWRQGARRFTWLRSTSSLSRSVIWDRSTR
jgi:hypothetical protein